MKAALPADEAARLADLEDCMILDTPPESAYDDLTKLASHICGTPIALVSLVDGDRQWFKSKVGLDATETPRDMAFCAHAILEPGILVVPDATADARFSDNPLVVGNPNIRFYAGAPLVTARGHGLGTLCVIDNKPRDLDPAQVEALRVLTRQVIAQIELRRAGRKLQKAREKSDQLLLSVLPSTIVNRLKKDKKHIADSFTDTTVLVAEVVDFSLATAELSPIRQVDALSQIFCRFDRLVAEQGLQKLKAMGITYYAIGGAPTPHPDPVRAAARVALAMQTEALNIRVDNAGPFCLRIGIGCGPAVAGVICANLLGYDVWGRTMDNARAMEASAPPGGIQITEAVLERLDDDFLTEPRGSYYVAGLGEVTSYLLKDVLGTKCPSGTTSGE